MHVKFVQANRLRFQSALESEKVCQPKMTTTNYFLCFNQIIINTIISRTKLANLHVFIISQWIWINAFLSC